MSHALGQALPGKDCLRATVEKEANFNNFNQILVICFQHICDTYSNSFINMVFDKMGLYHTGGEKCTTENYVTLAECDNDLRVL